MIDTLRRAHGWGRQRKDQTKRGRKKKKKERSSAREESPRSPLLLVCNRHCFCSLLLPLKPIDFYSSSSPFFFRCFLNCFQWYTTKRSMLLFCPRLLLSCCLPNKSEYTCKSLYIYSLSPFFYHIYRPFLQALFNLRHDAHHLLQTSGSTERISFFFFNKIKNGIPLSIRLLLFIP